MYMCIWIPDDATNEHACHDPYIYLTKQKQYTRVNIYIYNIHANTIAPSFSTSWVSSTSGLKLKNRIAAYSC